MGYTAWRQATREELLTDFEGAGRNDRSLWEALPDAAYHQAVLSRQFGRHDVPDPDHDRVGGRIFSRAGAWRVPSEGPSLAYRERRRELDAGWARTGKEGRYDLRGSYGRRRLATP